MKIDELTLSELRKLGESYGLDLPGTANKAQLIKLISASTSVDPDNVVIEKSEEEETKVEHKADEKGRVRVTFHNQEGDGGSDPVVVILNGYRYQIKREEVANIPVEVLRVIDDAVITEFYYDKHGDLQSRDRKRFPYVKA